jgi:hypothetical protein
VTIVDCAEGQSYGRLSGPTPPLENRASVGALSGRPTPGTLCIRRDARTPLVVTPMQAVSAGPRRAPRSILPLTPSSCLTRRLLADAGVPGDDQNKNQVDSLCALRDDDAGEVNWRPKSPF